MLLVIIVFSNIINTFLVHETKMGFQVKTWWFGEERVGLHMWLMDTAPTLVLVFLRKKSNLISKMYLGAHLGVGGQVKDECITCPFHSWEFDGGKGGKLTCIPYAEKCETKTIMFLYTYNK